VEFTIDTAWKTGRDFESIFLHLGDGDDSDPTPYIHVSTSASSAVGTFADAAGESYTLHKNKITYTYTSIAEPYTASFQSGGRFSPLKNVPDCMGCGTYGVGTSVRLNTGLLSTPHVSMPAIIQMYESQDNYFDIKPFIFYSGSDSVTCSYNANGSEFDPLPFPLTSIGFASLPTAEGSELLVTNDCKLQWDLTSHNPITQFDKYAVSMVIKVSAKAFVQSLDFIIELVKSSSPECSNAYSSKMLLWPPSNDFQAVTIQGVTDPNGNEVAINIDAIYSDEDAVIVRGAGGAKKAQDAFGVGTNVANLRAQRSGVGDGRVYFIEFTASNVQGGTCQGSVQVSVPHDQSGRTPLHTTPKPTTRRLSTAKPSLRKHSTNKPTNKLTTCQSAKPKPSTGYCFSNADLKSAVDNYISEECSTNITCATRLTYGKIGKWCTSGVTDMSYLFKHVATFSPEPGDPFSRTKGIFNDDISSWDVSAVTSMREMFFDQSCFNQNLNNWDVSSVIDMQGIFYLATSFNQPLDCWNVSSVTNMGSAFFFATSFNQSISRWDVSSVTNMGAMFFHATIFDQELANWDVGRVRNMAFIFGSAASFNQKLNTWNVSSVTNMNWVFGYANSFNQPLDSWNVRSVENMRYMFHFAASFNQNLTKWDVSSVTSMEGMFSFAKSFNQPLNSWNVSSVTSLSQMFVETNYNQNLNDWDVSSVTTMQQMFLGATSFNQKLNNWDVSSVTNMEMMFDSASSFNQPLDEWNVSSVFIMQEMFSSASRFDQNLISWDVRSVQSMSHMFSGASSFNQPLDGWNIQSVQNLRGMFYSASSFNQNLCQWGLIPSFPWDLASADMFAYSGCSFTADPIQNLGGSNNGPFCASDCSI
jgi:surface protein